jgi:hypothetical protein
MRKQLRSQASLSLRTMPIYQPSPTPSQQAPQKWRVICFQQLLPRRVMQLSSSLTSSATSTSERSLMEFLPGNVSIETRCYPHFRRMGGFTGKLRGVETGLRLVSAGWSAAQPRHVRLRRAEGRRGRARRRQVRRNCGASPFQAHLR